MRTKRRRGAEPEWLGPVLVCAVALVAAMGLKLHFDGLVAEAAAAGRDGLGLGSEVAGPGFDRDDEDTSSDGAEASRLSSVASAVDEVGEAAAFEPDTTVIVDPRSSGRPWSDLGAVEGLLTFRGNPTRSFYGRGPVPAAPRVQWSVNIGCSSSPVGGEAKVWCGSGWTGQPSVFQNPATSDWTVAFGGYNRSVNFLDPASGQERLAPFATGDIIKGSVTVDPDGFPLLYTGSRDNFFHVVALDRDQPTELWSLSADAIQPTLWNNDWDGSALVVDDHLFIGGENGRFYIVALNRAFDASGLVTVDPEIVFSTETWDDELLAATGDLQVSVENSVAISGDVVYFTNSAGLVQGWDVSGVASGDEPEQVLRFWTGDDTDASIVVDEEGMLYIGAEYERGNARSQELGQIIKLDPSRPDDPVVWGRDARAGLGSGIWATPALWGDLVIVATNEGEVLGLDRATGDDRWRLSLEGPLWSSPVVVDDTLVQADCGGSVHAFDLAASTGAPPRLWSVSVGGCIESTPALWDGQIFVGSRDGNFYAIGD